MTIRHLYLDSDICVARLRVVPPLPGKMFYSWIMVRLTDVLQITMRSETTVFPVVCLPYYPSNFQHPVILSSNEAASTMESFLRPWLIFIIMENSNTLTVWCLQYCLYVCLTVIYDDSHIVTLLYFASLGNYCSNITAWQVWYQSVLILSDRITDITSLNLLSSLLCIWPLWKKCPFAFFDGFCEIACKFQSDFTTMKQLCIYARKVDWFVISID